VGLVDDDVLPLESHHCCHAVSHAFKRGQAYIELAWLQIMLQLVLSLLFGCNQVKHAHFWAPLLEFVLPIWNHGFGNDYKEVILHFFVLAQEGQE
jgi:hypothetical protein